MSIFGRGGKDPVIGDTARVDTPNPGDLSNRINSERRRRLATGGTQSTFVTRLIGRVGAQAASNAAPSPQLYSAP